MDNKNTNEEIQKELKLILKNNNKTELENYIIERDITIKVLCSDTFDLLIYSIENGASLEIIQFITRQEQYEELNFTIHENGKDKNPLFSAVLKNKFTLADMLLKNGADINYCINNKDDGDIINYLNTYGSLNNKNLKYILNHGYDTYFLFTNINSCLISNFIRSFKNKFLDIIFKHYIFDNTFIINLLKWYKNCTPFTPFQFQTIITNEKNKLKIRENTYESYYSDASKEENYEAIKIIFENDGSEHDILFRRINLYDILEKAIKLNDYCFVKNILCYDSFSFKSIISEKNFLYTTENNNMEILKLLIEKALNLSSKENPHSYPHPHLSSKNITLVRYLLETEKYCHQININTKNENDEYPIITAFYANSVDIFKYLLEKGADSNTKNRNGTSLLSLVIDRYNYNVKFIKYLFEQDVNINEKDASGNYPLIKAIYKDDFDSVILLIKYGIKHHIDMNIIDVNGNTPLTLSYRIEHQGIFKFLVKYLDINRKDANGNSILYYSILNGDIETSKYLISNGADLNFIDKFGNSAFDISVTKCTDLVTILINNKNLLLNRPNRRGETPLISIIKSINSCMNKEKKISYYYLNISFKIASLIERGSDVNFVDMEGNTPLVYAIEKKSLSVVMLLIKNGANINFFIKNRNLSIVMYAIELNRVDIVKYLVKCGANINFKNENDINVLISTSKVGKTKIFEYLVKNNVNDFTSEIIHKIIVDNRLDLLNILIENDLNINIRDEKGNTPLVYAIQCRNIDITEYLISHGADCHNINDNDETIDNINYKYHWEYGFKDTYKSIYKLINNYR
ncbi:ankyrin [Neocallimastix lanati (nom. inval.)]|nr:ankyrin [Neocallimastix sp. JGI-2020a]